MPPRRPAMRSRRARLAVVGGALLLLLYHFSGGPASHPGQEQQQQHATRRGLAAQEKEQQGGSSLGTLVNGEAAIPRPKYFLSEQLRTAAIMNGSQQHGVVTKAGPLPPDFWTNARRPWREAEFMKMVMRDMAQPRSSEYWEADASGQLALRPLPLPFPLCHTYVNHKYKIIFIIHPKSASTATKRYMTLCRLNQTDSCLEPLDSLAQLEPVEQRWREYFVFTFVRNPWTRAYSSWKFLRETYMVPGGMSSMPGQGQAQGQGQADGSSASASANAYASNLTAKSVHTFAAPCVAGGWRDFCGDPLVLGRMCIAQPNCCPRRETDHFMFYHITDQATCLVTEGGEGLAVDYIGRVEHVDADMKEVVSIINSRLPAGVPPLQLPDAVAPINVGPKGEKGQGGGGKDTARPPDNSRYVPAYLADNAPCFSLVSRFYEKDVRLMFPALYQQAEQAQQAAAAAAAGRSVGAAAASGGADPAAAVSRR